MSASANSVCTVRARSPRLDRFRVRLPAANSAMVWTELRAARQAFSRAFATSPPTKYSRVQLNFVEVEKDVALYISIRTPRRGIPPRALEGQHSPRAAR